MRTRLLVVMAVLLMLAAGQAIAQTYGDPSFELGGVYPRWWPAAPWGGFTVLGTTYYHQPDPAGLPVTQGWPQVEYTSSSWDPYSWMNLEYNMTAHADTSAGYTSPVKTGYKFVKKNPGNAAFYSGMDQVITGLVPGQMYEASVYGASWAPTAEQSADIRVLVDTDATNIDARLAPIMSPAVPNRPDGQYWLWTSATEGRLGTKATVNDPDVIARYAIYDKISVRFTAQDTTARVFILMDWRNVHINGLDDDGTAIAVDDFSLVAVPEPSGLLALATPLVLGGLSLIRRRRS